MATVRQRLHLKEDFRDSIADIFVIHKLRMSRCRRNGLRHFSHQCLFDSSLQMSGKRGS